MPKPREVSVGVQESPAGDYIVLARFRVAAGSSLPPLDGPDPRETLLARREKARREIERRIAAAVASVEV